MLQYRQCKIKYMEFSGEQELGVLRTKIAEQLHLPVQDIQELRIERKSLDARKKPELFWNYTIVFQCGNENGVLRKNRKNKNLSVFTPPPDLFDVIRRVRQNGSGTQKSSGAEAWADTGTDTEGGRVLIIGAGPAGLMCGYFLALCGKRPVIIERGGPMWERVDSVSRFWKEGKLDADTNVSFGEGGAGTFSDGKLNTGVKDKSGKKQFILDTFIAHGAPEDIRYAAKPHIGTDRLRRVIQSMREEIEVLGGTYLFHHTFVGFRQEETKSGMPDGGHQVHMSDTALRADRSRRLTGIYVLDEQGKETLMACDTCVLAIGHSARDTFERLRKEQIAMEQKPFAVGVRVEHPQEKINRIQYGTGTESFPAADYKLTGTTGDGRGVYSFCMCPGGYVVNASTEDGMTAVNGMSDRARNSGRANSAVIVTVSEQDFGSEDVLAGVEFQRELERRTFQMGNGKIPVQRFEDFAKGISPEQAESGKNDQSQEWPNVLKNHRPNVLKNHRPNVLKNHRPNVLKNHRPCTKGEVVLADVRSILPGFISKGIVEGMRQFGKTMPGFDDGDTWILGTETRTSSPVRIVRDKELVSESLYGLYPCGEGAGYAGGIMSAAMDGLRVALRIAESDLDEEDAVKASALWR